MQQLDPRRAGAPASLHCLVADLEPRQWHRMARNAAGDATSLEGFHEPIT